MKNKIIFLLLVISGVAFAASTYTTHYNLEKSADGDTNWGSAYRTNMNTIDSTMYSTAQDITGHMADTVDAHDSTAISTTGGTIVCLSSTTVEQYLDCLDTNLGAITGGTVMTTDTNQTVTGVKTFSSVPVFSNGFTSSTAPTVSSFGTGIVHSSSGGLLSSSSIVNADVDAAAAIDYSKLNLALSIVNADISGSAAIAYSKLSLGSSITSSDITNGTIVNADINGSAAIDYSKLNLSLSILNADINASAGIVRSKLASGTASHVLINDGSGVMSSEAQLLGTRGGTGVSNSGSLTFGSNALTFTTSATTSITLPTSGTMATLAGTENFSNKTFTDGTTFQSTVKLKETGGGSDTIDFQAPASSVSYTITMPAAAPTANTALAYDGSNYVWSSAGGWTTYSNENITGSGSVTSSTTVGQQYRRVTGSGGAVTASSTPFGSGGGWNDGLVIQLIGQSNSNTVKIVHNDAAKGAILNGDCILGQYDTLTLQYDSTADRWIETSRSMK